MSSCNKTRLVKDLSVLEGEWEWVQTVRPSRYTTYDSTGQSFSVTSYDYDTPQSTGETYAVKLNRNGRATTYKNGAEDQQLKISLDYTGNISEGNHMLFTGFLYVLNKKVPFSGRVYGTSPDSLFVTNWPFNSPDVAHNILVRK